MLKLPGKIALAPMAGVTDRAFREICMEFGADYCITEMVSSKAVEQGNKKTDEYARLSEKEQPAAIQIFGDDPKAMAYCAENLLRNLFPAAQAEDLFLLHFPGRETVYSVRFGWLQEEKEWKIRRAFIDTAKRVFPAGALPLPAGRN